mgnify:CR=1 FL=1
MATATITPGNIYSIISTIAEEAGALAKSQSGGVPFAFRGIDAVINHLAPHLDKHGVFSTSRIVDKVTSARELYNAQGQPNGKAVTQTDVTVEYTFHAPDGSSVSTQVVGLAQDYADRSAAQAMSVAYRIALLQLFHLPTTDKEPEQAGEETQAYIDRQSAPRAGGVAKAAGPSIDALRAEISALIADESNSIDGAMVNTLLSEKTGKDHTKWTAADLQWALGELRTKVAA